MSIPLKHGAGLNLSRLIILCDEITVILMVTVIFQLLSKFVSLHSTFL